MYVASLWLKVFVAHFFFAIRPQSMRQGSEKPSRSDVSQMAEDRTAEL